MAGLTVAGEAAEVERITKRDPNLINHLKQEAKSLLRKQIKRVGLAQTCTHHINLWPEQKRLQAAPQKCAQSSLILFVNAQDQLEIQPHSLAGEAGP